MFSAHCQIKNEDIKLYARYALSFILEIMPRSRGIIYQPVNGSYPRLLGLQLAESRSLHFYPAIVSPVLHLHASYKEVQVPRTKNHQNVGLKF